MSEMPAEVDARGKTAPSLEDGHVDPISASAVHISSDLETFDPVFFSAGFGQKVPYFHLSAAILNR